MTSPFSILLIMCLTISSARSHDTLSVTIFAEIDGRGNDFETLAFINVLIV